MKYQIQFYKKSFGTVITLAVVVGLTFFMLANSIDSTKSVDDIDIAHTYPVAHKGSHATYLTVEDGQKYDFYINGFMYSIFTGLAVGFGIAALDYRKKLLFTK